MKTPQIGIVAALVASFAIAPLGAFAQSAMASDPDAIDYSALNNPYYNYNDLTIAKTRDMSDTRIAKLVKISEDTRTCFSVLSDAIENGATYYALSERYGFPLSDLDHVQKQKNEVSNYISAYETSGEFAYPDSPVKTTH